MSPNFYSPAPSLSVKEILFVGFERDFDANICNYPYGSEHYQHTIINHAHKAMHWLQARVDDLSTYQPPYAIFCELEWLRYNDFKFIHQLSAHPDLKFVPVIVLTEQQTIDPLALVCNGVDDCYTVPVEWHRLEERLEFLNQYKSSVLEYAEKAENEVFRLDMPLEKRIFDIIAASLGLLLAAPVMLLIAVAIRLESRGRILYRSKRVGAGYQTFNFLKFRSMYQDADKRLAELKHLNQYDGTNAVFLKFAGDPRITRVGRFIRKYSLDELPQLINILRGDMSIVGNRPLPLYEAAMLTREQWSARFLAPAGLTGLWQVTKRGKNDMSVDERVALDIEYARTYSAWTDFRIIVKTFRAFIQDENV
jgi:lipopolysaccharide/colanic/teichoic acid biosynthesis glycosyltransferase